METVKYILFYAVSCCLVSVSLLDIVLIPLIWNENPNWAKTRSIPRNGWERGGNSVLRWIWSVMSFDLNLRVTQGTRYLAILAGIVYNVGVVSLLLLILVEVFGGK